MQFCGDLPLFIYLANTHARHIAHRNRIKAIETAEMVDINNRPRRHSGLNAPNGLKEDKIRDNSVAISQKRGGLPLNGAGRHNQSSITISEP